MTPEAASAQVIAKISYLANNKPLEDAAAEHVRDYFAAGHNSKGQPRAELIAGREGPILLRGLAQKIQRTPAASKLLAAIGANGQPRVTLADVLTIEAAISGGTAAATAEGDPVVTTWLCDPVTGGG